MKLTESEKRVLAYTLLGEAGGEGAAGMEAVMAVIVNRSKSGRYPSNLAAVATQSSPKGVHQFSTWNTPALEGNNPVNMYSTSSATFQQALKIVEKAEAGTLVDPTGGATHFYATASKVPYWWSSEAKNGSVTIGGHTFAVGAVPTSGPLLGMGLDPTVQLVGGLGALNDPLTQALMTAAVGAGVINASPKTTTVATVPVKAPPVAPVPGPAPTIRYGVSPNTGQLIPLGVPQIRFDSEGKVHAATFGLAEDGRTATPIAHTSPSPFGASEGTILYSIIKKAVETKLAETGAVVSETAAAATQAVTNQAQAALSGASSFFGGMFGSPAPAKAAVPASSYDFSDFYKSNTGDYTPLPAPEPLGGVTTRLVETTVVNPEYTSWAALYDTGTPYAGSFEDFQSEIAAMQAPPPPPQTITVTKQVQIAAKAPPPPPPPSQLDIVTKRLIAQGITVTGNKKAYVSNGKDGFSAGALVPTTTISGSIPNRLKPGFY